MRETILALKKGEPVIFEGVILVKDETELCDGDVYIAERNTGPKLLTARKVDHELNCVFPVEKEYPYDIHECVKVRAA